MLLSFRTNGKFCQYMRRYISEHVNTSFFLDSHSVLIRLLIDEQQYCFRSFICVKEL